MSTSLVEFVRRLDQEADDLQVYVALVGGHWVPASPIAVVPFPDDDLLGNLPTAVDGMPFFLDTNVMKEFLEGWRKTAAGIVATPEEATRRLILYAVNDA